MTESEMTAQTAQDLLAWLEALGRLCASDHAMHAVEEMHYHDAAAKQQISEAGKFGQRSSRECVNLPNFSV